MTDGSARQITDPAALKAVAHPMRVRLLAALRGAGAATATELARRLGTETGSTSYHLRVLARYGFVADAPDDGPPGRRHPRERRWRAVHLTSEWSNTALAASTEGREATALMRRRQLEVLIEDVERFEAAIGDLDPTWVEISGIGDLVVKLSAGSLTALWNRFYAHLDELVAADAADPSARPVSVVVAGFPRLDRQ